jgi:hypothetical protein
MVAGYLGRQSRRAAAGAPAHFFSKGYGEMEVIYQRRDSYLKEIREGSVEFRLRESDIEWKEQVEEAYVTVDEGYFQSPLHDLLPVECKQCRFHLVKPVKKKDARKVLEPLTRTNSEGPLVYVMMLASTAETGKKPRLAMARELAREHGYASIILTAPYYGYRKPAGQTTFYLDMVSDLWKQFGGTLQEAAALGEHFLHANERSVLCWTGFSAGGSLSICAAWACLEGYRLDGSRLGVAAYCAPASASIYAGGAIQCLLDWKALCAEASPTQGREDHLSTVKQALFENLNQLSIAAMAGINDEDRPTKRSPETRLCAIRCICGIQDQFSPMIYAQVLEEELPQLVNHAEQCSIEWHSCGHVYAALVRPRLQKRLIVDAVKVLVHSNAT